MTADDDTVRPRRPLVRAAAIVAVLAQLAGALPGVAALPVLPRVDDLSAAGATLQASAVESAGAPVKTLPARAAKQVAALSGVPTRAFGPGDSLVIVEDGRDAAVVIIGGYLHPPAADDSAAAPTTFLPRPTGPPHSA